MANVVDQFDYITSMTPQGIELNKPYVSKNYNFINDINNGVYSNTNGTTLVQYDLTSIFNSSTATNPSDHFLIVPTVTCMQLSTDLAVPVAPSVGASYGAVSLKTGTNCTIHSADIQIDGKSIISIQPFTNIISNINLVSQMSLDDLKLHGRIRGLSLAGLDNPNSMVYSPALSATPAFTSQPALANNQIFNGGTVLNEDQTITGPQNTNTCNTALKQRVAWTYNSSANGATNNFVGTLNSVNNFNNELKPFSEIVGTTRVWYNYLYINLGDLFPVFSNIGVIRRFGATLRIYFNTGFVNTTVGANNQLVYNPSAGTGSSTSFTNTCPIMINNLGTCAGGGAYAGAGFTQLTAGFFIGTAPNYSYPITGGAVNFNNIGSALRNTRYYYSNILLDSLKYADYLASNQSKSIVSKCFLYNSYTNISNQGGAFSTLVQSGVKNIRAVMVIPLISNTVIQGINQFQNPFDSCGGCGGAPLSLINFNVSVGGVQQLSTNLTFTYENFVEEISIYNKSTSNTYGIESGLISYEWWMNNRIYICNIRSTADDDLSTRNIVVQFNNNNLVPIDCIIYTLYEEEWVVNVATGSFTHKM